MKTLLSAIGIGLGLCLLAAPSASADTVADTAAGTVSDTAADTAVVARPYLDPESLRATAQTHMHGCTKDAGPWAERCARVATTAYRVSRTTTPLWAHDKTGKKTADFLIVFVARESAGIETAIGDGGEAWGATQIHWRLWGPMLEGWGTISTIYDLFDLYSSMQSTLAIMRYLTTTCGSVRRAAYAYASGSCVGTIRGRMHVDTRCAAIGGC